MTGKDGTNTSDPAKPSPAKLGPATLDPTTLGPTTLGPATGGGRVAMTTAPDEPYLHGVAADEPDGLGPRNILQGSRPARPPVGPRLSVNCFTPGTRIATPRGQTPIEALRAGDMVETRDNGPQEVRWIGKKRLVGPVLRLDTHLHPVLIRRGALGPDLPDRDLRVSPGHRVLLLGDHPALDGAEAEVFVAAHHLVGTRGIVREVVTDVSYLHFVCDRHEVVLSNGAWTESFRPSEKALEGVGERAREELLDLFPGLAREGAPGPGGERGFAPARPMARRIAGTGAWPSAKSSPR